MNISEIEKLIERGEEVHIKADGTVLVGEQQTEPRIVTPLAKLLSKMSLDDLLQFLHEMNVGWYLRKHGNKYVARIHGEGMATYMHTSTSTGPKIAVMNVIVDFLVSEKHDFHDVQKRNSPWAREAGKKA